MKRGVCDECGVTWEEGSSVMSEWGQGVFCDKCEVGGDKVCFVISVK